MALLMQYEEKKYAVVIVRPNRNNRLFAWIKRNRKGEVFIFYAEDESANNPATNLDIHNSVHEGGGSHVAVYVKVKKTSKRRIRPQHIALKTEQPPTRDFKGCGYIFGTNANRAISPTLPRFRGHFDDIFGVPFDLLDGTMHQSFSFQLVEADAQSSPLLYPEVVLAEKSFRDDVPWIVVKLVRPGPTEPAQ
jgi:hypothetical protein